MKNKVTGAVLACMVAATSTLANANLITNGEFDTDTVGWTKTGDATHWGSMGGNFETFDNSGFSGLFQTVSTDSLFEYTLSFETVASRISGNTAQFLIGTDIHSIVTTESFATSTFSFVGTGSDLNVGFEFATTSGSGVWKLDNVTLTAERLTGQIPEPTTLSILALGVLGLASRRAKKQA